jgi:hypothetical protein
MENIVKKYQINTAVHPQDMFYKIHNQQFGKLSIIINNLKMKCE